MNKHRLSNRILTVYGILPLVFLSASTLRQPGQLIYKKSSLYNNIFVYQNESVVTLQFGRRNYEHIQSQVDMNNPRQHMLEYSKMAFCGLFYKPQPQTMLVLGLGGGVIPRDMRHHFPELAIDVAEIDSEIPKVATQYMGFKEDDKLQVHVDDGRMFIKKQMRQKPAPKYDIVVLDAFNGDYIPFHLMTKEFLEEVKSVLSDDGVVVANVFYNNRLFDAEFKTFISVFGKTQVYFGVDSGNAMLASTGPKGSMLTGQQAVELASQLQLKHNFAFNLIEIAKMLEPETQPAKDAMLLTDDKAPVNWLRERETTRQPASD